MKFINPAGYTPGRGVAWPLENHMTTQTIAAPAAGVHRSSDLFADDAGEKSIAQQHTELEPHRPKYCLTANLGFPLPLQVVAKGQACPQAISGYIVSLFQSIPAST